MRLLPVFREPPRRVTEIHEAPCKHCPSAHYPPDEECIDIKDNWPPEAQLDTLFVCAWRTDKLCKGYCDYLGFTEADVKKAAR